MDKLQNNTFFVPCLNAPCEEEPGWETTKESCGCELVAVLLLELCIDDDGGCVALALVFELDDDDFGSRVLDLLMTSRIQIIGKKLAPES